MCRMSAPRPSRSAKISPALCFFGATSAKSASRKCRLSSASFSSLAEAAHDGAASGNGLSTGFSRVSDGYTRSAGRMGRTGRDGTASPRLGIASVTGSAAAFVSIGTVSVECPCMDGGRYAERLGAGRLQKSSPPVSRVSKSCVRSASGTVVPAAPSAGISTDTDTSADTGADCGFAADFPSVSFGRYASPNVTFPTSSGCFS